jgi:hypothetical protein
MSHRMNDENMNTTSGKQEWKKRETLRVREIE